MNKSNSAYIQSFPDRIPADLQEPCGGPAPGWRSGNATRSPLSQRDVRCRAAEREDAVSDPSRADPEDPEANGEQIGL